MYGQVPLHQGDLKFEGGRPWFTLNIFAVGSGLPRYIALFARDLSSGATELIADVAPEEAIESFIALPDGTADMRIARHDGTRVTGREGRVLGSLASFLDSGWQPLPGCGDPEFGFHAMP